MTQIKKLYVKNYKNLPELNIEFKGTGLYIIKGKNGTGKTSLLNTIESLIKGKEPAVEPTHLEKENGVAVGTFEGDTTIEVTKKFEKNGKTTFSFVHNGIAGTKINDLKDLFNYTSFTAEEFIALGKNAAGQKKQQEIILNLLSIEDKQEFYKLKEFEKATYDDRTIANAKVKDIQSTIKLNTLTKEDNEILGKYDEASKYLKELNKQLSEIELLTEKKKNLTQGKDTFESNINSALLSIKDSFSKEILGEFKKITDKISETYDKDINRKDPLCIIMNSNSVINIIYYILLSYPCILGLKNILMTPLQKG
jgi:recombinational DNA repair ATPase RecF